MSEVVKINEQVDYELAPSADYQAMVANGLKGSAELGFYVADSLAVTVGSETVTPEIEEQAREVTELTASIARDMQLNGSFFERPANTIMLTAIADSWFRNEVAAADPNADRPRIIAEREALVDIASMLAGKQAGTVRDIAIADPTSWHRYIEGASDPDQVERDMFVDSLVDPVLSDRIQNILTMTGEGSFLDAQRKALGVEGENEQAFRVRVLSVAESVDIYTAHIQPEPQYPDLGWDYREHTDDENAAHSATLDEAIKQSERNSAATKLLTDPYDVYMKRFGDKFGGLQPAFVDINEDKIPQVYLRAPQALAIIKYFNNEQFPEGSLERRDVEDIFAIVRHEYGHTQKNMTFGVHNQLGLMVEERKAEYISGDKQGYQDVKNLFTDLSFATGVSVTKDILADALKQGDSLSAFLAPAAQKIGMRNAMLLMALKPLPYERYPQQAKEFVDLSKQQRPTDASSLEIPVRETLEKLGHEKMDGAINKWMRDVDENSANGLDDFHEEWLPSYRRHHGMGISAAKISKAVKEIRAAKKAPQ
ncbi:hypothetical protein IPL85_03525 [Candidatus Saccharibacteria bacterium]|nr:MAG: hypothetical protein IPL85_03525 [Candidatus Saccharibacteria bacterium]